MSRTFRVLLICSAVCGFIAAADSVSGLYVTAAGSALVERGLAKSEPTGSEAADFKMVMTPRVRFQTNVASATAEPWIDSNGSKYQRGLRRAKYEKLPPGTAALAAAEAFVYGVDAILDPDPGDVGALGKMLDFLKPLNRPFLPVMANIGVIDDGSPAIAEVLNLLTRRNLLYRVVRAEDPKLDLTVKLGSKNFPVEATKNPSEFAAMVRAKLTDEKRLVRLYGTSTTTAFLTGDSSSARLCLLMYSRSRFSSNIRVRLLGKFQPVKFSGFESDAAAQITDLEYVDGGTEFLLPTFNTLAVIDLKR
jgi:hypothetical protein